MSIWERAKAKAEELLGRAEEVYGQSHGDSAATVAGEAHRLEAQSEEQVAEEQRAEDRPAPAVERDPRPTDDDGLAGAR